MRSSERQQGQDDLSGETEGKRIKKQCQSQIIKALWVIKRTLLFTLREEDTEELYGEKQYDVILTGSRQRGQGQRQKDHFQGFLNIRERERRG